MLKRKIEMFLAEWKKSKDRKPLVIKGIRQCGKTYIVRKFASGNYESVVYMNFILEPDKKSAFTGNIDVDTVILNLSALIPGSRFIEGRTCIILDEIQECKEARTALKSFCLDGRFDVIATGSLLGVKGYGRSRKGEMEGQDSVPVGYETVIDMYPLDFEEFLWANGIGDNVIDSVKSCFEDERPVPDGIHKALMDLLYRYVIVGGLPAVVNCFLETRNIELIYKAQRSIISEYEDDMVKYADDTDKPHIRECFESIPKQLAKENKKFQYSVVRKGGRASQFTGSLQWLEDTGVVRRCYNTTATELPLDGNSVKDCFKVYTTDIGIFTAMLDYGTQADILKGNLELDFLTRLGGKCVALEVKSKTGKAKSLSTVLKNEDIYHISNAIKLGAYNVGREGKVLTVPLYMGFLVKDTLADVIIPDVDLSRLATI